MMAKITCSVGIPYTPFPNQVVFPNKQKQNTANYFSLSLQVMYGVWQWGDIVDVCY